MKTKLLFPALGIILAGTSLVFINEFTPIKIAGTYAYMIIVTAMLTGFGISSRMNPSQKRSS